MLQSDVKNVNKRIIFDLFREKRELTRVEVSQITGISMPSVLKAVQSLQDANILIPTGEKDTAIGRKPLQLRFNSKAISAFGVEYEGDRLSIGLVQIDGTVDKSISFQVAHQFDDDLAGKIISGIEEILQHVSISDRVIAGVGIGIPGAVNPIKKEIRFAPLIGIHEAQSVSHVLQIIETVFCWPVFIENDVNTLAIGETLSRKMQGKTYPADLLFISLGTGVGAGLILDEKLRHGCRFLCGEIGYYAPDVHSFSSYRQQGWLESQLNIEALKNKFAFDLACPQARPEIYDHISKILAPAISNIVNILDIETVVLGGVLIDTLDQKFIDYISEVVGKLVLNPVQIEKHTADEPGIIGAATLAINQRLDEII